MKGNVVVIGGGVAGIPRSRGPGLYRLSCGKGAYHTKNLTIWYYNKSVKSLEADMVVLCTTLMPSEGVQKVAEAVGVEAVEYGFFKVKDPLQAPLDTKREGIFLAGYCEAPKDIPDSVAQGSGAAMRAAQFAGGG